MVVGGVDTYLGVIGVFVVVLFVIDVAGVFVGDGVVVGGVDTYLGVMAGDVAGVVEVFVELFVLGDDVVVGGVDTYLGVMAGVVEVFVVKLFVGGVFVGDDAVVGGVDTYLGVIAGDVAGVKFGDVAARNNWGVVWGLVVGVSSRRVRAEESVVRGEAGGDVAEEEDDEASSRAIGVEFGLLGGDEGAEGGGDCTCKRASKFEIEVRVALLLLLLLLLLSNIEISAFIKMNCNEVFSNVESKRKCRLGRPGLKN